MTEAAGDGELALSLVRGDPLWRAQRALGLVPRGGLGVGRRALAAVLVPAALPMLLVLAIEVPVKDLLLGILKTLT